MRFISNLASSVGLVTAILLLAPAPGALAGVVSREATTLGALAREAPFVAVIGPLPEGGPYRGSSLVRVLEPLQGELPLVVELEDLAASGHAVPGAAAATARHALPDTPRSRLRTATGPALAFLAPTSRGTYRVIGGSRGLFELAGPEGEAVLDRVRRHLRGAGPEEVAAGLTSWLPRVADDAALELVASEAEGLGVGVRATLREAVRFNRRTFTDLKPLIALCRRCDPPLVEELLDLALEDGTVPALRLAAEAVPPRVVAEALRSAGAAGRTRAALVVAGGVLARGAPETARGPSGGLPAREELMAAVLPFAESRDERLRAGALCALARASERSVPVSAAVRAGAGDASALVRRAVIVGLALGGGERLREVAEVDAAGWWEAARRAPHAALVRVELDVLGPTRRQQPAGQREN